MKRRDKVLVVDDNRENVEILSDRLGSMGYEVGTAFDGVEAIESITAEPPDAVVLDIIMPKMDGFEVLSRMKADPATEAIPVIMLTSRNETPDKVKGLDTGADDYVTKPFNPKELAARIKALIRRRAGQEKRATEEKLDALGMMAEGVAHEVRNPMVTIGGFARRLVKELDDGSVARRYAESIVEETTRLEKMVNAIVDLKALMLPPGGSVKLRELLESSAAAFKGELETRNVTFTLNVEDDVAVKGSKENLSLVFMALIENAFESISSGGDITITAAEVETDAVVVLLEDTGRGIPKGELNHVLSPFFTSKTSGAGIGLTMVHRIIRNHGGELSITSKEGEGTKVRVTLPKGDTTQ
ncbi:MAG: hypothetical protein C0609_10310 [Deltaproteobacteria bacterium]|nr:MAG: hypothetical protein C0609_10310 [Deltaproteobacteria bacterium]